MNICALQEDIVLNSNVDESNNAQNVVGVVGTGDTFLQDILDGAENY
jgi:hypothetical protein